MTKKENILSWRNDLQGKSRSERVKWFYTDKVIPSLAEDVQAAENARQNQDHQQVQTYFEAWTQRNRQAEVAVHTKALQRSEAFPIEEEFKLVSVGLAGLARIKHVDLNSMLTPDSGIEHDEHRQSFQELSEVYDQLDTSYLAPYTIHGGSIHWLSELNQDMVKTYEKSGRPELALIVLVMAIHEVSDQIDQIIPYLNLQKIRENRDSELIKQYLGAASALTVLTARLAMINNTLEGMQKAVRLAIKISKDEMNAHRLATLSLWAIRAASARKTQGSVKDRLHTALVGARGLVRAAIASPQATMSAAKQALL